MDWIKVEDGLPEYGINVLVFGESSAANPNMGGPYMVISKRMDLRGTLLESTHSRYLDKNQFRAMAYVTHWMPLPEPPKY